MNGHEYIDMFPNHVPRLPIKREA